MHRAQDRSKTMGASRGELVMACGLLLALAGVVAPVASQPSTADQSEHIVAFTQKLQRACIRHYVDLRTTATEFSIHGGDVASYHQLSHGQGHPRWNGPYLEEPISAADNPCGGDVFLYPDLRGGEASVDGGFDPMGRGRDTVSGKGQFVAFTQVPEDVARGVEAAIDGESTGTEWRVTGRCEYDRDEQTLMLLVLEL